MHNTELRIHNTVYCIENREKIPRRHFDLDLTLQYIMLLWWWRVSQSVMGLRLLSVSTNVILLFADEAEA